MYPGKPITKKLTKMSTGKPITNFFGVNQLGLSRAARRAARLKRNGSKKCAYGVCPNK